MALGSSVPDVIAPSGAADPALLLCPELFATEGGIARVSRLYLEALTEIVPGGRLVVLNDARFESAQLARHLRGDSSSRGLGQATACGRSKLRLARAVLGAARSCPRVLSTHVRLLPVLLLARIARPGLAWDVVLHGIEAWGALPPLARLGLRRARRAYCVSEYTRGVVAAGHPSLALRLRVLHNAIDPGLAAALRQVDPAAAEPGRILAVSRLAPHDRPKGIDHLIAAMPAIRAEEPRATLHIVGEGRDRAALEAMAAASPAREAITFHGHVDEAGLVNHFARCSLFALPSEKEGFGLVYAEAMAAGRPCVAARAGGAPEVVGETGGLLVPYGDLRAIAQACGEALRRTWSVPSLRARAELFSPETFYSNFNRLWTSP